MTPRFKRFVVAADNHGGIGSPDAISKILRFTEDFKPHHRIHLGDAWDFSPLRRGAGQEEKAEGIEDDYVMGWDFLEKFRPNFLTLGNHDDRIWMNARHRTDGILRETCAKLSTECEARFKKMRIQWCGNRVDNFLQMPEGGPKLLHGFRSTVNPAMAHFSNYGACLHGHVHRPDDYTARHVDGESSFSVGCLADITQMEYADKQTAKLGWRNGFLFGYINSRTGKWHAWHVKKEGADWVSPLGPL